MPDLQTRTAATSRPDASAAPDRSGRLPFRPDVEGLRAVAVLLVVAHHAVGVPTGGFVGVDVFFVLSGYLITRGLLHQRERDGGVGLARFFVRRVARLLPAAVLVVLVTAAACLLLFFPITAVPLLFEGAASLLSVENWALIRQGADYLAPSGAVSPFQHFWSLSVEEQFYALWPWLLVLAWAVTARLGGRSAAATRRVVLVCVLVCALVMTAASLAVSVLLTGRGSSAAYFLPLTRAWEFGAGAVIAVIGTRCARALRLSERTPLAAVLRWAGIGLIALAALAYSPATPYPGVAALLPVAGAALVVLAGETGSTGGSLLTLRPVRYVGRISYSLYLWHAPVLILLPLAVRPVVGRTGDAVAVTAVAVALAVGLAAATHRFVEEPARRARAWERVVRRLRIHGAPVWTRVAGIGVTAGAIVALSAIQWQGPAPVPAGPAALARPEAVGSAAQLQERLRDAADATVWTGYDRQLSGGALVGAPELACMRDPLDPAGVERPLTGTGTPGCVTGGSLPRQAVVVGDSIAMSWVPAVREALGDGWGVTAVGLQSCPAALVRVGESRGRGGYPGACLRSRSADLDTVADLHPDLIVLASAESGVRRLASGASGTAAADEWQRGLEATLDRLSGGSAHIVVLGNPPETVAPQDCARRTSTPAACDVAPGPAYLLKADAERLAVASAAARGIDVRLIDTLPWFCVDARCPVGDGRLIARIDHGHLTADYSRMLGPLLRPELTEAAR